MFTLFTKLVGENIATAIVNFLTQVLKFIQTPIGAAIIAALVAYPLGYLHERSAWKAHEAELEQATVIREKEIAIKIKTDVDAQQKKLADHNADLQKRVSDYEQTLNDDSRCALTDDDVRSLRAIDGKANAHP